MSDTIVSLRRKIDSAGDLQSVVRTMKALAAASIGQYERAVDALAEYERTVDLALGAFFRSSGLDHFSVEERARPKPNAIGAVVFGSDQGLVGGFNEVMADFVLPALATRPGEAHVWAVGERVQARLADAGLRETTLLAVPTSVETIGDLVGKILVDAPTRLGSLDGAELLLFHNRPVSASTYEPVMQRLLPLDDAWRRQRVQMTWPTARRAEILGDETTTLRALIREYVFISLFKACAESLASENASRLSAMQRADKNIDELLETLNSHFHQLRQSSIDEELFDVIAGANALTKTKRRGTKWNGHVDAPPADIP